MIVEIFGDHSAEMDRTAERVAESLRTVAGAADVRIEQTSGLPTLSIDVDRGAIARYGLTVADVQDVAAIAIGGRTAGHLFEGDRRFDIVVRLSEAYRRDLAALENLPIPLPPHEEERRRARSSVGKTEAGDQLSYLPLGSVARIRAGEGPSQISRENGMRRVVVQANVRGRDLGSFIAEAEGRIDRDVQLPAGSWVEWGGQFENLIEAKRRLSIVVPICFLAIFGLLYATLGSARQAALVFTGVPLALSGGVVSLWLREIPFSISAAVGFIALSGVAVLNGLVMVTFINELRDAGIALGEAIHDGAMVRLRPVLMTALVASLGFVPMALATGTGAEVQKPLATVVIGGLISATALTLFVLPALYRMIEGRSASQR